MVMSEDRKFDRFDFEQGIMQCWNVVEDIKLLAQRGAPAEDFEGLSRLYHHKFDELWAQFEKGIEERKIV
jgi:hypothetical protein